MDGAFEDTFERNAHVVYGIVLVVFTPFCHDARNVEHGDIFNEGIGQCFAAFVQMALKCFCPSKTDGWFDVGFEPCLRIAIEARFADGERS